MFSRSKGVLSLRPVFLSRAFKGPIRSVVPVQNWLNIRVGQLKEAKRKLGIFAAAFMPTGGLAGQFLGKNTGLDFDVSWLTIHQIPAGGTASQILAKNSGINWDVVWKTPSAFAGFDLLSVAISTALAGASSVYVLVNAAGGNRTITLPAPAANVGFMFWVKKVDASGFLVTILPNAAETIDGVAAAVIDVQGTCLQLTTDGTNWSIL